MSELTVEPSDSAFDRSDVPRTAVLALLQLVPGVGGSIAQIIGDAWATNASKRIEATMGFVIEELIRLHSNVDRLRERVAGGRRSGDFFWEVIRAAPRTVSDEERRQLGNLLARGLSLHEMHVSDSRSLLQRWQEIDTVERPVDQKTWDAGKYPWRINHFWPSKIGGLLYTLIGLQPKSE